MKKLLIILFIILCISPVSAITHYKFTSGANTVEVWNNTIPASTVGFWIVPAGVTSINYVLVGGGGAGGAHFGGGGGAGGFLNGTLAVSAGETIVFAVGTGGTGTTYASSTAAGTGGNTTLSYLGAPLDAYGGGGGARRDTGVAAVSGGSGGGGGGDAAPRINAGTGQPGQGANGGAGYNNAAASAGGGGGGNQSAGSAAGSNTGGNGGAGVTNPLTGVNVCYSGGGGGYGAVTLGTATCGGGAASTADTNGVDGTANTGGGGGGAKMTGTTSVRGGNGGSGIAIISYTTPTASQTTIQVMNPYQVVYFWRRTA